MLSTLQSSSRFNETSLVFNISPQHFNNKKKINSKTYSKIVAILLLLFVSSEQHISDDNFYHHFSFFAINISLNIPLFRATGVFAACLLSCNVQRLPLCFSTGVCESRYRRAGSCKLLISLHIHQSLSLIESAYTCNHMLQPTDRSILSATGRDKLSPSAVPPRTLNVVFVYTLGLTLQKTVSVALVKLPLMCSNSLTACSRLN